jgi:two-component sensor histidine kinase
LLGFIKLSYSKSTDNTIQIIQDVEQVDFTMESALPFSLFIHELITNSFKHAFIGREDGLISIKLHKNENGFEFHYADNGIGFDPKKASDKDSIGINLINAFTEQLDGELIDKTELGKGCNITLTFKTL